MEKDDKRVRGVDRERHRESERKREVGERERGMEMKGERA